MQYKIIIPVLLAFALCTGMVQETGPEQITWNSNRKLQWDDFKGPVPKYETSYGAATNWEYSSSCRSDGDSIQITLFCFFNPDKSWVKPATPRTAYILQHEQTHFDIAEANARKTRKLLKESTFYRKNQGREFKNIYHKAVEQCRAEQDLYDKETNHSIVTEKQEEWNKKVAGELKQYEQYQNAKIRLPLK